MKRRRPTLVESLESRLLMAVVSVLNNNDSGEGSLRDAIAVANAGDTVDLSAVAGTITVSSELLIDKDLTVAGPGAAALTVSGNDSTRVLEISARATVRVSDLTLAHGHVG